MEKLKGRNEVRFYFSLFGWDMMLECPTSFRSIFVRRFNKSVLADETVMQFLGVTLLIFKD